MRSPSLRPFSTNTQSPFRSPRAIARGDLVGDWLFVEKGLKMGEKVVADGAHKVRKGDRITPAHQALGTKH